MKATQLFIILPAMMASVISVGAQAATIDLTGLGFVQYGDAQSYSLPIANYQYGYNTNNGLYAVDSTAGQIKDLIVVATSANGQGVTTNSSGMDNAYITPTGVSGSTFFFTNTATSRGTEGTVVNNGTNTWDASLASLKGFLGSDQMVVFFNNNQVKSDGTAAESLAAWARVWVTNASNTVLGTFEFTNNNGAYNLVSQGGGGVFMGNVTSYTAPGTGAGNPDATAASGTDFVLSGGNICVATGPGIPAPIPVSCSLTLAEVQALYPAVTTLSSAIDHNLGADHAAYAVLFPELNALLAGLFSSGNDLTNFTLHADIRMGCMAETGTDTWMDCGTYNGWGTALNNGYEQVFIGTARVPNRVPEPGTLAMLGLGLLSLGFARRRKQS